LAQGLSYGGEWGFFALESKAMVTLDIVKWNSKVLKKGPGRLK